MHLCEFSVLFVAMSPTAIGAKRRYASAFIPVKLVDHFSHLAVLLSAYVGQLAAIVPASTVLTVALESGRVTEIMGFSIHLPQMSNPSVSFAEDAG
jgi:hypothetical protein